MSRYRLTRAEVAAVPSAQWPAQRRMSESMSVLLSCMILMLLDAWMITDIHRSQTLCDEYMLSA